MRKILPPALAPIGFREIIHGLLAMRPGSRATADFTADLKDYFQVRHCFLLSSGKAALTIILRALKGLYPDRDEVLIPAFTCYSVPAAVYRAGLKLRVCDVEPATLDFDFRELARQLSAPRLLCVIPTHLFGVSADVPRVRQLIGDLGIPIVEDAAQTMGGERAGRKAGTLGDVGFFSLERGKALSTVKGGVIMCDDDQIGAALQAQHQALPCVGMAGQLAIVMYAAALAVFSRPRLYWLPKSLPFLRLGETLFEPDFPIRRLSACQAGLAAGWRHRLQESIRQRRKNAEHLARLGIEASCGPAAFASGLLRYPVLMRSNADKKALLQASDRLGLGASDVYPGTVDAIPLLQNCLVGGNSPKARTIVENMITLPVHPRVTENRLTAIAGLFTPEAGGGDAQQQRAREEDPECSSRKYPAATG